ncbi:glycosyltransferase family 4 protein [Bryobacter aggregatus]|uniref:glycosyltransferase family 4 protein n=1 Tax=Bryobacter aggregatus TaxID=360054 RepID=UPI0004E1A13F|nr:glycosyltransferase family 4 protein [Bryobacter aggregatus]
MRILLADSGWKMRGGQWQTLYLAEALREHGHTVTLLARHGSLLWDLATRAHLPVRHLGLTTMFALSKSNEVIHVQDASSHTLAAIAARQPFVVSRRVAFPIKQTYLSQRKYARPAGYLAISQAVARELRRASIDYSRIRIVPDGVPDVEPAKYQPHVAALKSDDPGKLNNLIRESCTKAGAELLLSDNLSEAISSGFLFLYLSENEGLGSAILLAMAAGLPIIASRVGGIPEAVDEGFSGLLVPNDSTAIAQAINILREDRNLALRFGENARRRYLKYYTLQHMVDNTLAAYRDLLHV